MHSARPPLLSEFRLVGPPEVNALDQAGDLAEFALHAGGDDERPAHRRRLCPGHVWNGRKNGGRVRTHPGGPRAPLMPGGIPKFAARLSAEDPEDIAAGDIALGDRERGRADVLRNNKPTARPGRTS
jgi:hypothetical protein